MITNTVIILLNLGILIMLCYSLKNLEEEMNKRFTHMETIFISGDSESSNIDELLKRYEVERDAEFDKRIEDMKVELYGTSADILVNGISNIEHEDVDKELLKLKEIKEEYAK